MLDSALLTDQEAEEPAVLDTKSRQSPTTEYGSWREDTARRAFPAALEKGRPTENQARVLPRTLYRPPDKALVASVRL